MGLWAQEGKLRIVKTRPAAGIQVQRALEPGRLVLPGQQGGLCSSILRRRQPRCLP